MGLSYPTLDAGFVRVSSSVTAAPTQTFTLTPTRTATPTCTATPGRRCYPDWRCAKRYTGFRGWLANPDGSAGTKQASRRRRANLGSDGTNSGHVDA